MKRHHILATLALAGSLFAAGTAATFASAPANPPSGNVAGPIDQSANDQAKSGGLQVGSLVSSGSAVISNAFIGDVGFGPGWAGFVNNGAHSGTNYTLLSSSDGKYTFINNPVAGGYVGFRLGNSDVLTIDNAGDLNTNGYVAGAQLCIGADCRNTWPTGGGTSQWTTSGSNIYYNSGNVGIGTASPGQKLEVNGGIAVDSVNNEGGTIMLKGNNGTNVYLENINGTFRLVNSPWTADIFHVDQTGNVAVAGTLATNGNTTVGGTLTTTGNTTVGGTLNVTGASTFGGTITLPTAPGGGTDSILGGTGDGATYSTYDFALRGWYGMALQDYSGTVHGVYNFRSGDLTTDGVLTMKGTGNNTFSGSMYSPGFFYNSDRTLKTNIQPLSGSDALAKVQALQGVSFNWKKDGSASVGLIAQDVEKVYPQLVATDKQTGLKSVEYGNLVAPLIEAVKAQQKEIETLQAEVAALKAAR